MKTNKTKFLAILIALSILLASMAFAEPKSLRYNQFYSPKSTLSGYATAIPPNTSITGNAIEVQPSTSSSPTFVVKETGYVGIGIPGPQSPLHIKTSAGQLKVSEAGANSVALTVRNNANDGYGSLALNASDYWWQTSGNTRMFLDDQGRLGVGTNSPDSYLGISDERGGTPGFKILDRESSNAERVQAWVDVAGNSAFRLSDVSGNQQVFLRSVGDSYVNGGNVGIGTKTPQSTLDVKGNIKASLNNEEGMRIGMANNKDNYQIRTNHFLDSTAQVNPSNPSWATVLGGKDDDSWAVYRKSPGAPEVGGWNSFFYIKNDGKVGIGTSTPTSLLHVNSSGDSITTIQTQNTNAAGTGSAASLLSSADWGNTYINSHGSGRTLSRWGLTLGGYGEVATDAGKGLIVGTRTATPLIFGTNAAERMRVDSTGNVGIGTSDPKAKLDLGVNSNVVLRWTTSNGINYGIEAYEDKFILAQLGAKRLLVFDKEGNVYLNFVLDSGKGKFLCIDDFNKVYKRDVPCNT